MKIGHFGQFWIWKSDIIYTKFRCKLDRKNIILKCSWNNLWSLKIYFFSMIFIKEIFLFYLISLLYFIFYIPFSWSLYLVFSLSTIPIFLFSRYLISLPFICLISLIFLSSSFEYRIEIRQKQVMGKLKSGGREIEKREL